MFGEVYPYTEESLPDYFHDLAGKAAILAMPALAAYRLPGTLDAAVLGKSIESLINTAYDAYRKGDGTHASVASAGPVFVLVQKPDAGQLSVEVMWTMVEGRWWKAEEMFLPKRPNDELVERPAPDAESDGRVERPGPDSAAA
jgi:hypothetical protein